ncbi:HAD domain-containing protein [Clostridium sp. C8-1-8]|uniref:HAD domain-containing protein n=1 Tax=Clostridium sp. C8-1-8 TaxID=2698831 RepID=UPI001370EC69|nr:HAD domain-containing protein [Clostridium sp. C8-1-8]
MKIIFLDVDGVLNTEGFLNDNPGVAIDYWKISILKYIIKKTGALIVMSSGWRLWFDDNMMPTEAYSQQLYDIFRENRLEIYDKTPDFSTDEIRERKTFSHVKAKEIVAWLEDNKDIEKYVVIDDLLLKDENINAHLVKINGEIGLTFEDALSVISMLS